MYLAGTGSACGRLDLPLGPVRGQFAGEGFLEEGLFEFRECSLLFR